MVLLFVCMNTGACHDNVKQEISRFRSHRIIIPADSMLLLQNERDRVIDNVSEKGMKLVVYSDSSGCSSCKTRNIYEWEPYIRKANESGGALQLLFIFSPLTSEIAQLKYALASTALDCPVFIDTLGIFAQCNPHLPDNNLLHTFLLDEGHRVVLVGNPLRNKRLEEMYQKVIGKQLTSPQTDR